MENNFIDVYNNSISEEICDKMISYFDKYPEETHKGMTGSGLDKTMKMSTDLSMLKLKEKEESINTQVIPILSEALGKGFFEYAKKYPLWLHGNKCFGKAADSDVYNELFRKYTLDDVVLLKRYNKGVDGFHAFHEDQGRNGPDMYKSNLLLSRVLVCMFYLNDVKEGGETEFYFQKLKVKPTKGSLVIFPTYFTHLHKGHIPISNDKYICNLWILKKRQQ